MKNKKPWSERTPLESFDPRYKQLWLEGALSLVSVELPSEGEASTFLLRAQMYRKRYQEKFGPAEAAPLYKAKGNRKGTVVSFFPADQPFENILSQFPIRGDAQPSPGERAPDSQTPIPEGETPTQTEATIDELFSQFKTDK